MLALFVKKELMHLLNKVQPLLLWYELLSFFALTFLSRLEDVSEDWSLRLRTSSPGKKLKSGSQYLNLKSQQNF
jgi:hypothetical protein